jgi:uncharacterized protein
VGPQASVAKIRAVLDTKVVVSALLFGSGRLQWLLQLWQRGEILPVVNRLTTMELLRVLTYPKFRISQSEQEDVLAEYLPFCEVLAALDSVPVPHVRDAADKVFLQLALATRVAYLVTGDDGLLVLATVLPPGSVRILTPDQLQTELTDVR